MVLPSVRLRRHEGQEHRIFTYIHVHKTHIFIYMGQLPLKISLRLNCYTFQTVKAIDFLFSTLHTTPFLYGEIRFGVL